MSLVKIVHFFLLFNCLFYEVSLGLRIKRDKFEMMLVKLAKIVGKCASPTMDNTGVVRHSLSNNNLPIDFISNISVINLQDSENSEEFEAANYRTKGSTKIHNLQNFIILTSSVNNFRQLISKLRKSLLWNPLALYLILDDRTAIKNCENAYNFLNTSWAEDLLYSTYFCVDPKLGFTMYTYNPYSKRAPDFWEEVNSNNYTFKNHVWSLFRRRIIPGGTTCEDFSFDKTMTIDGYPINTLALHTGFTLRINESQTGLKRVGGPDGHIIREPFIKLNATLNLAVVWNSSNWYKYDPKVKSGEYDILLNVRYIYNKFNTTFTYPHEVTGISLLTQHPGYEEQYIRILTYMNPKVIASVFLVFAGTSFVIFLCTRKGLIHSALESYRLLLGTSTVRSPKRNPLRILLTTVILLFMLTNAVFQSALSSLLTVPIHKPYIDCRDDLKMHPDFLVHVSYRHKAIISEDWMDPQVRTINKSECTEYVLENPKAACAAEHTYLIDEAYRETLHVTRQPLAILYLAFIVRPDWPLRERVSSILSILGEAGIIKQLREASILNIIQKWMYMEKEQSSQSVFRVMVLSDLRFAFYILLSGLSIAILVFFLECWIARRMCRGKRRTRMRRNVRHEYCANVSV